ncbi:MAG: hypothetical protein V3V02_05165 [Rhizobiaceae bacterium]
MTISKELMLAILSMDAYNQGYGRGVKHDKSQIGAATVSKDSEQVFTDPNAPEGAPSAAKATGFYAVNYTIDGFVEGIEAGTNVISYRGTDWYGDYKDETGGNDIGRPCESWGGQGIIGASLV